jgi:hypothetical protein
MAKQTTVNTESKPSRLQQRILHGLLRYDNHVAADPERFPFYKISGVPVRWLRGGKQYRSPAESAAFSRALRRLETGASSCGAMWPVGSHPDPRKAMCVPSWTNQHPPEPTTSS